MILISKINSWILISYRGQKAVESHIPIMKENNVNQKFYIQQNCASKWRRNEDILKLKKTENPLLVDLPSKKH